MLLLNFTVYSQCVSPKIITTSNYSQLLTQSNTYITISSSVYPLKTVKLDANPNDGYVLMTPGFYSSPSGNNAFIAQSLDGCGGLAPVKMVNIEDNEEIIREVIIYPNPTTEFLNLVSNNTILSYKIYSLDGKEIIPNKKIANNKEEINVSNFAAGFYIIYIETEVNEVLSFKFVKK